MKRFIVRFSKIVLVLIFIYIGLLVYSTYFFTFRDLKGELLQRPVISPTGKYTANAYYKPYGGAAGGIKGWVMIKDDKGDERIVYYGEANTDFRMRWIDDHTLYINNEEPGFPEESRSVKLNLEEKVIYHDTGEACKSLLMKNDYDKCLSK